jgi:hypothetical protein
MMPHPITKERRVVGFLPLFDHQTMLLRNLKCSWWVVVVVVRVVRALQNYATTIQAV